MKKLNLTTIVLTGLCFFSLNTFANENCKLYVGNLSFNATEDQVRDLFSEIGLIEEINWISDRDSGRFRGFCFVKMANCEEAKQAVSYLNGKEVDGRPIRVNIALPRDQRDVRKPKDSRKTTW